MDPALKYPYTRIEEFLTTSTKKTEKKGAKEHSETDI